VDGNQVGGNQVGGNLERAAMLGSLMDLKQGETAILERLELPQDDARRLMELGFIPGMRITAGFSAPGGDPRVFQVDGSEFALRRDTARQLKTRPAEAGNQSGKAAQSRKTFPKTSQRKP
jgi:ferrous iron transport protein A